MGDKIGPVMKGFTASGVIGKIIIAFTCIIIIIFLGLMYYSLVQNDRMLAQLTIQNKNVEKLIENQTQIEVFKRCIKKEHDKATKVFNNEFLILPSVFRSSANLWRI